MPPDGRATRGRRRLRRRTTMQSLIEMLVALEMLLLPAWVGAAFVRPPDALGRRVLRGAVAVAVATVILILLAAFISGEAATAVLRSQAVAAGFLVLLIGIAAATGRLTGPRPAQVLTTLLGWLVLAAVILGGPVVELVDAPVKEPLVRTLVYANPLIVAEHELGLQWLHQSLTYQLTPIGESYAYLFGALAWWETFLAHLFIGSGLFVFSLRMPSRLRERGESGG